MRLFAFLFLSTAVCFSLRAEEIYTHTQKSQLQNRPKEEPIPWLTGPLLTPSGHVIPDGHYNVEPYEFVNGFYGTYDNRWHTHNNLHTLYIVNTQVPVQIGMPWNMDFTFTPSFAWNHVHGASQWVLNDMNWGFDYQLLYDKRGKWWPAIKLALRANFPFGKYQKLDLNKQGTDAGGTGSWLPGIGLTFSQLYWWGANVFFAPRLSFQYTFPTAVHVKGLNTYGGGHHTHGTVYPGQILQCLFGFEIALTQRWAIAGDFQYLHINKTRFRGHKGKTNGVPNLIGSPSSEQFSIAPAIEYDWSAYVGIIAGVWFSIGGRNQLEFATGVVAINIYK